MAQTLKVDGSREALLLCDSDAEGGRLEGGSVPLLLLSFFVLVSDSMI